MSGDIGRLAGIPFGHEYDDSLNKYLIRDTLFQTVVNIDELKHLNVQVLTIGDSFSQQGNSGYQNYLCSKGLTVANVSRELFSSPIQYTYNLMNETYIDSTNAKIIIVECVGRTLGGTIEKFDVEKQDVPQQTPKIPNQWSVSRARDYILFKTHLNSPILLADLNRDFFTSEEPRKLYFFKDDIRYLGINKDIEAKTRYVFNILCSKAEERGIKLLWLIAVDKYDLYQDYIKDNTFPRITITEDINRIIGSSPNLILSKQYLKPLLVSGTKDVFLFNDTHWSYKASETIADELISRIAKNNNVFPPHEREGLP